MRWRASTVTTPVAVVLVIVAGLVLVAGVVIVAGAAAIVVHLGQSATPAPAATSPVVSAPVVSAPATTLRGTDAAWLQLMIALDDSALPLLDLARRRTADPRLGSFVAELAAAHRAELADLRRIAVDAALAPTDEHDEHDIPGMVTSADLARIEALPAAGFDAAVRDALREHLGQVVHLAAAVQAAGTDPRTKAMAAAIHAARTAHLARFPG